MRATEKRANENCASSGIGPTDFHEQYLKRCCLVRGGAFSMIEKIDL